VASDKVSTGDDLFSHRREVSSFAARLGRFGRGTQGRIWATYPNRDRDFGATGYRCGRRRRLIQSGAERLSPRVR